MRTTEASDGCAPRVILVDEDPAMEAACYSVFTDTVIFNCIWHLGCVNLSRNLRGSLGRDWDSFISSFWKARNSITVEQFERRWAEEVEVYGEGKERVQAYLERIYERRTHWAWPWVGSRFTAGMQYSTGGKCPFYHQVFCE